MDPHSFLRIRIQLFISMRIRIQLFISVRIRIQQLFKCGSGSSLTKFVTNYFMKSWACPHYLILNKKITIFLHFSVFSSNFSLLDLGSAINISRRENECGVGSIALPVPAVYSANIYLKFCVTGTLAFCSLCWLKDFASCWKRRCLVERGNNNLSTVIWEINLSIVITYLRD